MLSGRVQRQSAADLAERRLVIVIMSEATDVRERYRLIAVIQRAQLYNIAVYSVGIPTTLAELKAPGKDSGIGSHRKGHFHSLGCPERCRYSLRKTFVTATEPHEFQSVGAEKCQRQITVTPSESSAGTGGRTSPHSDQRRWRKPWTRLPRSCTHSIR